jgi:hypothetical protein
MSNGSLRGGVGNESKSYTHRYYLTLPRKEDTNLKGYSGYKFAYCKVHQKETFHYRILGGGCAALICRSCYLEKMEVRAKPEAGTGGLPGHVAASLQPPDQT